MRLKSIVLGFLICLPFLARSQSQCIDETYLGVFLIAEAAFQEGKYEVAVSIYDGLASEKRFFPEAYFYFAESLWYLPNQDSAFKVLELGLQRGLTFQDTSLLKEHPMMASFMEQGPAEGKTQLLRNYEQYKNRIITHQVKLPEVQAELLRRRELDQMRSRMDLSTDSAIMELIRIKDMVLKNI